MLVIGIKDNKLDAAERGWIRAPQVSGVILFKRNFQSRDQVTELIADIRACRDEPLLVCVDQEGGPVQRFREGFTRLPPLARIGEVYLHDPQRALELAGEHAWLMASEMRAIDIDLSFAPVLDLARGNVVIGERAFHADPEIVSRLGLEYVRNLRLAGMAATLKHFPGHGSVREDTHLECAVDNRSLDEIRDTDLVPFADAIAAGAEAVMMGHVAYPAIDAAPAGYSRAWIGDILRGELGFRGVVFSDDISMAAAESAGGIGARIAAHRDAGCDIVLACKPEIVPEALAVCRDAGPCDNETIEALRGRIAPTWHDLIDNPQHTRFAARLTALENVPA
ncbi:MAG: beta-N-acetylhexosaminidase [Proteobacteria bacterium]|nr:beta-N-acetylhexosaminidase [Pseudomonadota bacterium]